MRTVKAPRSPSNCRRIECAVTPASAFGDDAEWLDRLERRGVVRRGTGTLSGKWLASRPEVKADVVAALLQDREVEA